MRPMSHEIHSATPARISGTLCLKRAYASLPGQQRALEARPLQQIERITPGSEVSVHNLLVFCCMSTEVWVAGSIFARGVAALSSSRVSASS